MVDLFKPGLPQTVGEKSHNRTMKAQYHRVVGFFGSIYSLIRSPSYTQPKCHYAVHNVYAVYKSMLCKKSFDPKTELILKIHRNSRGPKYPKQSSKIKAKLEDSHFQFSNFTTNI